MADLIRRDSLFEGASRMTVHCAFRADPSSGGQLHEMQLFGIEWPTLTNSLSKRFNRCDVLRMLPRQAEVEARFVAHMHTHCYRAQSLQLRDYLPNESRRPIVRLNTSLPGRDSTLSAQK